LLGLVRRWRDNPEGSNSVALCGHKGIGKSTVLARFAAALHDGQDGPRVVTVELREKVVSEERLVALVGAALGIDLAHGAAALVAADAQLTPTVIVIDDAHKLFLRRENGFAAFHGLAALLNARTRNLFWCAGFNHYAWRYLEDVFASAQPFRDVCELAPWSDHDIEQLIVRRHARSGYRLRFDQVILAAGDDAADYIESRFFRLLWEQSGGIPRTALALWRSAVHCVAPGLLHVSLPAPGLDARIAQLPMDVLFALAAVVRHENLTSEETTAVSGVAPAVIRQAFAVGREIGLIERDPAGRYRVCPQAQPGLVRILGTHNLIYE
jgi:energy-coupling factor transporter ATP-binding protein EcfA2